MEFFFRNGKIFFLVREINPGDRGGGGGAFFYGPVPWVGTLPYFQGVWESVLFKPWEMGARAVGKLLHG